MEWPTNIGRTLGGNHGRYGHENISLLPLLFPSADGMSEAEQRELEYVMALSVSEMEIEMQQRLIIEREKEKSINAQVEEDEQLAHAIQLSIVMVSSLTDDYPHDSSSKAFTSQLGAPASKICAGCNTEIRRSEHILGCKGIVWHAECLLCHGCRKLIKDDKLSMSENRPYHTSCSRTMRYPKCYVCNNLIPSTNGEVVFGEHPFWAQKFCPFHENDGTFKCNSCERLQPRGCNYILLKDGRRLCPECSIFKIMDTDECQPLFHEIQEFFASLHMKLNQKIPLFLVEREALNGAMEGEKNGHHQLSETRGLCVSEVKTIPIIHRRKHTDKHPIFDMLTQPLRLVRNCEVTAILVLYGLPRLLTGSILAHEMMHAWLRLQRYPILKPDIEEGICQVLAHMWLKSKIKLGSEATRAAASSSSSLQPPFSNENKQLREIEMKLGDCFKRQIELDDSSVYGDGFRVGEQAVSQYGLKATLDHIKLTQTFPV